MAPQEGRWTYEMGETWRSGWRADRRSELGVRRERAKWPAASARASVGSAFHRAVDMFERERECLHMCYKQYIIQVVAYELIGRHNLRYVVLYEYKIFSIFGRVRDYTRMFEIIYILYSNMKLVFSHSYATYLLGEGAWESSKLDSSSLGLFNSTSSALPPPLYCSTSNNALS